MRNKKISVLLVALLNQGQPAFSAREGWDVLNSSIKVPGCTSSAATDWGTRPDYVVNCDYRLLDKRNRAHFYFHVTNKAIGYLEQTPRDEKNPDYPGWLPLSIAEANRLWGTSHAHKVGNSGYITFDVFGRTNGDNQAEKNLYHIDIRTDDNIHVSAYRIRGVALINADWIYPDTSVSSLR